MGNILAIDPALAVGWAHTDSPGGVWHNPGETLGERLAYFGGWLSETLAYFPTDVIAYELAHHRGGPPTRLGVGWQTLIEYIAQQHGCVTKTCHTATLKKHATGNGRATKEEMLAAARKRNPTIELVDDNHIDATFLLDWALCN